MTLNLPPDPNDAPRPAAPPSYQQPQPQYQQPVPQQPAPPAFPDGSRGAAYREPYVVTRRNSSRMWLIIGGIVFGLVVVIGTVVAVAVVLIGANMGAGQ